MQDAQIFLQPQLLPHIARIRCSPAYLRPPRVPHEERSSLFLYGSRVKCHLLLNNVGFTYYYRFYPADGEMAIIIINLLTPNVNYSGLTAPLTSKVAFYIFIQQI